MYLSVGISPTLFYFTLTLYKLNRVIPFVSRSFPVRSPFVLRLFSVPAPFHLRSGSVMEAISDEGLETIEYISVDCTATEGQWHSDSEIKIDKLGYVIRNGQKTKDFWNAKVYAAKQPLRIKIRNICGDETIFPL